MVSTSKLQFLPTPLIMLNNSYRLTIFSDLSWGADKCLDSIDVTVDGELHPIDATERIEHLLWHICCLHLLELLLGLL